MISFIAVLWFTKVLIRLRKLYRLRYALTNNVVVRLDGPVNNNQHIDAISVSHLQQILNNHLTHSTKPVRDLQCGIHLHPKTAKIVRSQKSENFELRFTANCFYPSSCEVYYGLSVMAVKELCVAVQRTHLDSKKSNKIFCDEIFSADQYVCKQNISISAGENVKVVVPIETDSLARCFDSTIPRYVAVVNLKQMPFSDTKEKKKRENSNFELTMLGSDVRVAPDSSMQLGALISRVHIDHQLVGNRSTGLLHLKDVYGLEDDDTDCLICLSEPRDVILLPCRHTCICKACLHQMLTARCPVCRTGIDSYLSFDPKEVLSTLANVSQGDKKQHGSA